MNFLKILLIFILIAITILFFSANTLLEKALRLSFEHVQISAAQREIYLSPPAYESVRFLPPGSILIRGFKTAVIPPRSSRFSDAPWQVEAAEIRLSALTNRLRVDCRKLHVLIEKKGEFRGDFLKAEFPFEITNPGNYGVSAGKVFMETKKILTLGSSELFYEISGRLRFYVAKETVTTRITTESLGTRTYLVMDKKDVQAAASSLGDELTDAEVDFVSRHPLQAPKLLAIMNIAKYTSMAAHASNVLVPEKAYRHVLWSYLLTRRFGPEFAKQVTDAHEIGSREPGEENPADHAMDYHNNTVGRRYAAQGIPESRVLSRFLSDKAVIRSVEKLKNYPPGVLEKIASEG